MQITNLAIQNLSSLDAELLSCFYEGISHPRRLAQGLQLLAELLACERVSLRLWDRRGHWGYAVQAGLESGQWKLGTDDHVQPEPLLRALVSKFEPGQWQRLGQLAPGLRGADVSSRLIDFLPPGERVFSIRWPLVQAEALLSLHAGKDDWPHSPSHLALATDACRVLLPALEPIARLQRLSGQCDHLAAMLNGIRLPMVLLDAAVRPLAANHAASELFRLSARLASGKVVAALPGVPISRLAQLVERACAAQPCGGASEFALENRSTLAHLLIFPLAPSAHGGRPPAALAVVQRSDESADHAQQLLQHVYRLTPAEARLTQLILDGLSPGHVATTLQLSVSTVRTQLSAVLKKTGAQRQADLVRRLSPLMFLKSVAAAR